MLLGVQVFAHDPEFGPYKEVYLESSHPVRGISIEVWNNKNICGSRGVNAFVGTDDGIFWDSYLIHIHAQSDLTAFYEEVYMPTSGFVAEMALNCVLDLGEFIRSRSTEIPFLRNLPKE